MNRPKLGALRPLLVVVTAADPATDRRNDLTDQVLMGLTSAEERNGSTLVTFPSFFNLQRSHRDYNRDRARSSS
ncbi:hypothetical protein EJ02DRAFT_450587 [Clathrospora elynae]|uniref:Uncharacterized protein n=1 Tax=Clathrospora elynae TaxID=706981 RepID=A0A6A5T2S5_9PLEO|nr:hypothetical protein EJ02DRAFT_450587 [Clathrospora elynae]